MALPDHATIDVHLFSDGVIATSEMSISTEYPVSFYVNDRPYAVIACSGNDLDLLVAGHMKVDSLVSSFEDIESIHIDEDELRVDVRIREKGGQAPAIGVRAIVTGGGRSISAMPDVRHIRKDLPRVRGSMICGLIGEFLNFSDLHNLTHGVHSAALYGTDGRRIVFYDEIGRHNAIDKVIGYAMKSDISLSDKMLYTTGRVSSEIAGKVICAGIPVLVSRASPTTYCVEIMKKYNVLFLCRARDKSFIIINGMEHVDP